MKERCKKNLLPAPLSALKISCLIISSNNMSNVVECKVIWRLKMLKIFWLKPLWKQKNSSLTDLSYICCLHPHSSTQRRSLFSWLPHPQGQSLRRILEHLHQGTTTNDFLVACLPSLQEKRKHFDKLCSYQQAHPHYLTYLHSPLISNGSDLIYFCQCFTDQVFFLFSISNCCCIQTFQLLLKKEEKKRKKNIARLELEIKNAENSIPTW